MRPRAKFPRRLRDSLLQGTFLIFAATGCGGGADPNRLGIDGKVTLDGQPLKTGAITFVPTKLGQTTAGTISAGSFSVDRGIGLSPGNYTVEIHSIQPTGQQVKSPDEPNMMIEETRNIIPGRYNAATLLKAEVKAGTENHFRFELTSAEDPKKLTRSGKSRTRQQGRILD